MTEVVPPGLESSPVEPADPFGLAAMNSGLDRHRIREAITRLAIAAWALRRKPLAGMIALLVAASIGFAWWVRPSVDDLTRPALAAVERGALEIDVVTVGTLTALRSVTIASEIESNRAKVVRLAREGANVQPGDLLVEFDPTPFQEDVTKQSRAVKEAEATLAQAKADQRLQESKRAAQERDAKQRLEIAKLDLEALQAGRAPLSAQEARARVEDAEQRLAEAARRFDDAKSMLEQGFINRRDYEQADEALRDARRAHALAQASYENLVTFRNPAELRQSQMSLARVQSEVDGLSGSANTERERQNALVVKAESALAAARADLAKAQGELGKARIESPVAGFLLFNDLAFGSERRKVQVGDTVWNGQALMTIPDLGSLAVESFVREFDVHKIQPEQKTTVELEAFPDLELAGHVGFVGKLASARSDAVGGKRFDLRIALDQMDPRLRPGMTAHVTIHVDRIDDALTVPAQAVVRRGDQYFVLLAKGRRLIPRAVRVGASNNERIAILDGLAPGDSVSVEPRLDGSW